MAFEDEIVKLQRALRVWLRYEATDNPTLTDLGTRRYGKVPDNTLRTHAVVGTVDTFGTFSRAVANYLQSIEVPSISTTLLDPVNDWRLLLGTPWRIINRWTTYVLRVRADDGTYYDREIFKTQITQPDTPPGKFSFTGNALPGEYLGGQTPRRTVTLQDWPNADSSALGKPVPWIYGKCDNKQGLTHGFTGVLSGPSAHSAPTLTSATAAPSGSGVWNDTPMYYALATITSGTLSSPVSNVVGPVTADVVNNGVVLAFTVPGPVPTNLRIFRSPSSDFSVADYVDIAGAATSYVDTYPGRTPPWASNPWTAQLRETAYYWLSSVKDGDEQVAAGPLIFALHPLQRSGRTITLSWNAFDDADSLILRRAIQSSVFRPFYDRQWALAASAVGQVDTFADTTSVTVPDGFGRNRPGAVELLLVDTNPAGTPGAHTYLVAGHGCKHVTEVYVRKTPVLPSGGGTGGIERPKNAAAAIVGTPGAVKYRYTVTALAYAGETVGQTTGSNEVWVSNAPTVLDGSNYVDLSWDAVEGAIGYQVFRADESGDFALLNWASSPSYHDDGTDTPNPVIVPPEINTTGTAYGTGSQVVQPEDVLQTKGVWTGAGGGTAAGTYQVAVVEVNGNRYQVVQFASPQAGSVVTANVYGVEEDGDATGNDDGGTLIERGILQFRHWLYNAVFNSYRTGSYFADVAYRSGLLDDTSFDDADTVSESWLAGGFLGAGISKDLLDVRPAIEQWLATFGLDWVYTLDGQFKVRLDPPAPALTDLAAFTPRDSIFKESFKASLVDAALANHRNWGAGPQFDGFALSSFVEDTFLQSSLRYGRVIEGDPLVLPWTRDPGTASKMAAMQFDRLKHPLVLAKFAAPLGALVSELGDLVTVTHPDGIATSTAGWEDRRCKILRMDLDFDNLVAWVTVLDVTPRAPSTLLLGEYMAEHWGGNRYSSLYAHPATGQAVPTDFRDVPIDWDTYDGVEAVFRAYTLLLSTGSVLPTVHCTTDTAVAATADAVVGYSSPNVSSDTFTESIMVVSRPALGGQKRYRLVYTTFTTVPLTDVRSYGTKELRAL